jgi:hypothetical protein
MRNTKSASTSRPKRMCHTIALPPILAVTTLAAMAMASVQWKTRVGKSHTRSAAGAAE